MEKAQRVLEPWAVRQPSNHFTTAYEYISVVCPKVNELKKNLVLNILKNINITDF